MGITISISCIFHSSKAPLYYHIQQPSNHSTPSSFIYLCLKDHIEANLVGTVWVCQVAGTEYLLGFNLFKQLNCDVYINSTHWCFLNFTSFIKQEVFKKAIIIANPQNLLVASALEKWINTLILFLSGYQCGSFVWWINIFLSLKIFY